MTTDATGTRRLNTAKATVEAIAREMERDEKGLLKVWLTPRFTLPERQTRSL